MSEPRRSSSSLFGFILGVTGTGFILSSGMLTLVIILNWIARQENGNPSVSSQLMVALCGLIFAMGIFVFLGSMSIWKLSVRGAGINLGLGIVLLALAEGLNILLSDFVPTDSPLWFFLTTLYFLTGIASTMSGILGIIAHFTEQKGEQRKGA